MSTLPASKRRHKMAGLCITCGQPRRPNNAQYCDRHAALKAEATARYRQRLKGKGLCLDCRVPCGAKLRCTPCATANVGKYPLTLRKRALLRKFGLSEEEYQHLLLAQGKRCRICGDHQDNLSNNLSVDHCHKTGEIRGLLCIRCNSAIGFSVKIWLSSIVPHCILPIESD